MKTKKSTGKLLMVVTIIIMPFFLESCSLKCLVQNPAPLNGYATDLKNANHFMDSLTARSWIDRYKVYKDSVCNNAIGSNTNVLIDSSQSFNRALLQQILCLKNCIGLRVYNGMDSVYKVHIILGGIDQYGNTLYITDNPFSLSRTSFTTGQTGLGEMARNP